MSGVTDPDRKRATDPSPETVEARPDGAGRVLSNLLLLSLFGVGASVWVWFYTEWFPVVASLLGLGGVFTWLAFLSGLLRSSRKQQLQEMLDRRVLAARWTPWALLAVVIAAALAVSLFGAVVVRSTADPLDRTVRVAPADEQGEQMDPTRRRVLLPRSERTLPVWTGWGERTVEVRVSGLPPKRLQLRPLEREILEVPSSFRAAVELSMPPRVAQNLERDPRLRLVLRRNGSEVGSIEPGGFHGQTVWLGPPPEGYDPREAVVLASGENLREGDRLVVEVLRNDGGAYAAGELTVSAARGGDAAQSLSLAPVTEGDDP